MKKGVALFLLSMLLLGVVSQIGFAGAVTYPLCSFANCNQTQQHSHDGCIYAGHYVGDGHDYHRLCNVRDCTQTCVHLHNGVACMPHYAADGHSYHSTGTGRGTGHHGRHSGGRHH